MKCSEIMAKLEELSPLSFAESWDNVGLLVGSREREVESVMIALDATDAVIDQAVLAGADMLLTHHPLIFFAPKQDNGGGFYRETDYQADSQRYLLLCQPYQF